MVEPWAEPRSIMKVNMPWRVTSACFLEMLSWPSRMSTPSMRPKHQLCLGAASTWRPIRTPALKTSKQGCLISSSGSGMGFFFISSSFLNLSALSASTFLLSSTSAFFSSSSALCFAASSSIFNLSAFTLASWASSLSSAACSFFRLSRARAFSNSLSFCIISHLSCRRRRSSSFLSASSASSCALFCSSSSRRWRSASSSSLLLCSAASASSCSRRASFSFHRSRSSLDMSSFSSSDSWPPSLPSAFASFTKARFAALCWRTSSW
mmetsp:Transcript_97768/g.174181  ORF Transcript_97768/g.174181 Transcript_97768/m.174181 type:complete len:266 (-) Transcript_97768:335-1132(-)